MVNIKLVPEKVMVAASLMIIIAVFDLVLDLYRQDGSIFQFSNLNSVIANVVIGMIEILSGYLLFYGKKYGWVLAFIMGVLEIGWGVNAILEMDYFYIINLILGPIFVILLLTPTARKYCFDDNVPKPSLNIDDQFKD